MLKQAFHYIRRLSPILLVLLASGPAQAAPIQCWISFFPQGNAAQWMSTGGITNSQSNTFWLNATVNPGTTEAKFVLKSTNPVSGENLQLVQKFVDPPSAISIPYAAVYSQAKTITFSVKDDFGKCNTTAGLGYVGEGTGLPLAIPDLSTVTSSINMSSGTVAGVHVSLWISHTYDADLDISLISPDNTRVLLTSDNGGAANNYGSSPFQRTVFADEVDFAIPSGTAPFVGAFNPEEPLSAFIGKEASGAWTLEITDDAAGDTGELMAWSISILYQ